MKIATRFFSLLLILSLSACVNNPILQFDFIGFLPVFYIVENPVNPVRAKSLADALGISNDIIAEDGSIRYLDEARFQTLPMIPLGTVIDEEDGNLVTLERFDFPAIQALEPFPETAALNKANAALEQAGLRPRGGEPRLGHSRFEAVDVQGQVIADVLLDTHVDFEAVTPNGFPIKGPGADIKIVFDSQGVVTQLQYAFRTLTEGSRAGIVSEHRARREAAAEYFDVPTSQLSIQGRCASSRGLIGTLCLEAELVYYAPPIDLEITQILPHYLFSGTFEIEGESLDVRRLLVPAVENALSVQLSAISDGNAAVRAKASVTGGRGPYRYSWSSSSTSLPLDEMGSEISYKVAGREPVEREILGVVVTDADGVSAWTTQATDVNVPLQSPVNSQQMSTLSVGAQWIGLSQNLPYARENVGGFLRKARDANIEVAFNFGDKAAYHRDFAKETDEFGIEQVDLTFYTGHATGLGFSFESERDRQMFFSEQASWGEQDLEWLVIAACGPLQEVEFGIPWWRQWGNAFNGLHLILGYANITYDNNREGAILGHEIFENSQALRQAWASTATSIQTSSEIYAVMGVWDTNGLNNYNDHFWGLGPVGPDIPRSNIAGYWRLSGPS